MLFSEHIIHVNEGDFQNEVLLFSAQRPVVVDFWAEWSIPGRSLASILEKLSLEAAGAFRLAKVDVDSNPKLAEDYQVRGIPAVKVFRNGQVVAEFSGLRPEAQIREFLNALGPGTEDIAMGKANSLLNSADWVEAEEAMRVVLNENPDHPIALLGLAKSLLAQGQPALALPILREFPVSKQYSAAEQLIPLAAAMADLSAGEELDEEDPLAAVFMNVLRLTGRGQIAAALDGLIDILRQNKRYRGGEAQKVAIGLLSLLGESDPQLSEYRRELSSLFF
jgi:putative thioredoxin